VATSVLVKVERGAVERLNARKRGSNSSAFSVWQKCYLSWQVDKSWRSGAVLQPKGVRDEGLAEVVGRQGLLRKEGHNEGLEHDYLSALKGPFSLGETILDNIDCYSGGQGMNKLFGKHANK